MRKEKNGYPSETISHNIPEEILINLPKKLKKMRSVSGMTTNEVGVALGITPSSVTNWENGNSRPHLETLFKLRDIYQVKDLNEFFEIEFPPDLKTLSKSEQELIDLWRSSNDNVKKSVKLLLKECNKANKK